MKLISSPPSHYLRLWNHLTEVKYKIGTTGTLQETKTHKLQLEGMFGPAHFVTTSKELMDEGTLAKLKIQVSGISIHRKRKKTSE